MITEVAGYEVQHAKSIEIGIINPAKAPVLIAENGCIAIDMNVCKPDDLRAIADALEGKKKPKAVKAESKTSSSKSPGKKVVKKKAK